MQPFFGSRSDLDRNPQWLALVRRHRPYSTAPTLRSSREQLLRVTQMELLDNKPEVQIMKFPWSQFDCIPSRPQEQGSSACGDIVTTCVERFMEGSLTLDALFDERVMRGIAVDGVRACDKQRHTSGIKVLSFMQET